MFKVERREKITYNNDPQRRCYNGCHASLGSYWTPWEDWAFGCPKGSFKTKEDAEKYAQWSRNFFTKGNFKFRVVEIPDQG